VLATSVHEADIYLGMVSCETVRTKSATGMN